MGTFREWHCESPHCGPLVPIVQSLSIISLAECRTSWNVVRFNLRKTVILSQKLRCTQETQKMPMSPTDTVFKVSSLSQDWYRRPEQGIPTWLSQEMGRMWVDARVDSSRWRRFRFVWRSPPWRSNSSSRIAWHPWWPASSGHREAPAEKQRNCSEDRKDMIAMISMINANLQNIYFHINTIYSRWHQYHIISWTSMAFDTQKYDSVYF